MSTLIKLVVLVFVLIVLYGAARPLGIATYCRITVGSGNGSIGISSSQILNYNSSSTAQNQQINQCISYNTQKYSWTFIDTTIKNLSSPINLP